MKEGQIQFFGGKRMRVTLMIALVAIFVLLSCATYLLSRPHLWHKVDTAKVLYEGNPTSYGEVYRSAKGEILVRLNSTEPLVIYYPSRRLIGVPNANNFFFFLSLAYSKEEDPPVILSNDKVKLDHDLNLTIGDHYISFTSISGGNIAVELPNS
jgi:hypothetical protein